MNFYIGNTSGRADDESIKKILHRCTEALEDDDKFEVIEIECLTKDESPHTKCWWVAVPYNCKEMAGPRIFLKTKILKIQVDL